MNNEILMLSLMDPHSRQTEEEKKENKRGKIVEQERRKKNPRL